MNPESIHDIEKCKGTSYIIIEIHIGVCRTFSESFETSKMNYSIEFIITKKFFEGFSISNVDFMKIRNITKYGAYAVEHISRAIYKTIEYNGSVSSLFKSHNSMGANISKASSYKEYFFIGHV